DLGIEPSARLKELERRMLQQDPALDPAPPLPTPTPRRAEPDAQPRTPTCPSCGTSVPTDARFCASCGAPLAAAAPHEEMLKLVTVLFADVVDSTARAETLHPEDVRALMTDFFEAMARELRAEGGTIEKYAGDEIMAVFGVPTAHED